MNGCDDEHKISREVILRFTEAQMSIDQAGADQIGSKSVQGRTWSPRISQRQEL